MGTTTYLEHESVCMFLSTTFDGARRQKTFSERIPQLALWPRCTGLSCLVLEHPEAIESYLQELDALWQKFREEHPIPDDLLERFRRGREELSRRSG